jgi:hypothetical protein
MNFQRLNIKCVYELNAWELFLKNNINENEMKIFG